MKYIIPVIQVVLLVAAVGFVILGVTVDEDYLISFVACWMITGIVQPVCALILTWQYRKVRPFPRLLTYYWLGALIALAIYFLVIPTWLMAIYFTVITWKFALKK